jgi:hypothetical protein
VDTIGSAYITGTTTSTNFPTAAPLQAANAGGEDAFVTRLSVNGSGLAYSTYLGGSNDDRGADIAVDFNAFAYVVGTTRSSNFPTKEAIQSVYGGGESDAFVAKFTPRSIAMVYSTFLGGSDADVGSRIAVDVFSGAAFIAGTTFSTNFPTKNPLRPASGASDAFAAKIGEPPPSSMPTGASR